MFSRISRNAICRIVTQIESRNVGIWNTNHNTFSRPYISLQPLQSQAQKLNDPVCKSKFFVTSQLIRCHGSKSDPDAEDVTITYIDRNGVDNVITGKVGDNVMYLAQRHDLDVEGACEASLACCTCHVYVEQHFEKLDEIDEEEEDMLDLAPFLQENSRLSCQIILSKELDGIIVRLPCATRNFYVDGHKPQAH